MPGESETRHSPENHQPRGFDAAGFRDPDRPTHGSQASEGKAEPPSEHERHRVVHAEDPRQAEAEPTDQLLRRHVQIQHRGHGGGADDRREGDTREGSGADGAGLRPRALFRGPRELEAATSSNKESPEHHQDHEDRPQQGRTEEREQLGGARLDHAGPPGADAALALPVGDAGVRTEQAEVQHGLEGIEIGAQEEHEKCWDGWHCGRHFLRG
mmetsp:Transcript_65692/g.186447  ORF Transcript_65692/g.186447 Transcript_65692/m.186447 type:complete len:213 (+) Transcript_65692:936-1574(+)